MASFSSFSYLYVIKLESYSQHCKLECFITPGAKALLMTDALAYWLQSYLSMKMKCREYGQRCTTFVHLFSGAFYDKR